MLFSSLITFYSISTGLIRNLTKVTVGTYYDIGASSAGCGADPGVKIMIQKPDGTFCSVPLPAFSAGNTMTRERAALGDCRFVDFDVGLDSIRFWISSTENVCVNTLTLRFSTAQGQVTFMGMSSLMGTHSSIWFDYSETAEHIFSVENKSRKLKKFLNRNKKDLLVTPCALLQK